MPQKKMVAFHLHSHIRLAQSTGEMVYFAHAKSAHAFRICESPSRFFPVLCSSLPIILSWTRLVRILVNSQLKFKGGSTSPSLTSTYKGRKAKPSSKSVTGRHKLFPKCSCLLVLSHGTVIHLSPKLSVDEFKPQPSCKNDFT